GRARRARARRRCRASGNCGISLFPALPERLPDLVEHLRDAANTAVYGPGAWHFLPRGTWLRHAAEAGLRRAAERRIAGLVTAFAFRKPAS
ncbi:hypothetical protein ABZW03_39465, partial [Kitasatospora sp. NPDC004799]|uniref:hypothetical protein n=1 Tax=Kitasatospora sp. NPDC004799 TaxID=3154460 RepID=UPI0033BA3B47